MEFELGAPFELRPRRTLSSSSSSSSILLSCSSTDEDDFTPLQEPNASDITRDPFSASAKTPQGLKIYSKSKSRADYQSPSTSPGSLFGPPNTNATPKTNARNNALSWSPEYDATPVWKPPSLAASPAIHEDVSDEDIWNRAIYEAIDNANGKVDLSYNSSAASSSKLTFIPSNIKDLSKLVILGDPLPRGGLPSFGTTRNFSRTTSAPAAPGMRPFQQAAPSDASGLWRPSGPVKKPASIELYLSSNAISKLPQELFTLKGLVVLSLRANRLEYIPPSIACLTELKVLNLSNNRILFLPAEIQQLKLDHIQLLFNPLLDPPKSPSLDHPKLDPRVLRKPRVLSELVRHWPDSLRVPPLSELAYRVLLSPNAAPEYEGEEPMLKWQMYKEDEWLHPGASECVQQAFKVLHSATPSYVTQKMATEDDQINLRQRNALDSLQLPHHYDSRFLLGAESYPNHCPSPSHQRPILSPRRTFTRTSTTLQSSQLPQSFQSFQASSDDEATKSRPYLAHAESRLEWVEIVAGTNVPDKGGIPILWRGCSPGCLSFLDSPGSTVTPASDETLTISNALGLRRGMVVADSQRTIQAVPEECEQHEDLDVDDLDEFMDGGWDEEQSSGGLASLSRELRIV